MKLDPETIAQLLMMKSKTSNLPSWWCSAMVATTLWFLWFARCKRIFQNEPESPVSLFFKIIRFATDQKLLTKWDSPCDPKEITSGNAPYKIWTDGSFVDESQLAGIGWTISHNSDLIATRASPVMASSIIKTQLLVVAADLEDAKRMELNNFPLFTDSLSAYLMLSRLSSTPKELKNLISHCRRLLREGNGSILWMNRANLSVPDSLDKLARLKAVSNFWSLEFPPWLKELVCNDISTI